MIIQDIYLENWDWYVRVFYAVDTYYINNILGELECIGCTDENLKHAEKCLKGKNVGLTYSIGETLDLDVFGEEYEYLVGDIGQEMFPIAKQFLCEHCRKDL